ncbi:E3 ubiquitin-protein ligase TRIM45-like [Branchiostoma floridae x Branchiostoma belcheri]
MAAGLVSEINEEFLVCQICYNDFERPKILPCLHTFCQGCLEKLFTAQVGPNLSCPTCRQDLSLPPGGVQGLKDNFLVSKLRDVVTKPGRPPANAPDVTICRVCSTGTGATSYCVDCQEHLCQVCTDAHRRLKLTRAHNIVSTTDNLSPVMADRGGDDNTALCPRHGEINKFYCDTCHLVICLHCVVTAHKDHRYVEIEEVAEREKKNVRRLLPVARGIAFLQQAKLNEMHSLKQKWDARVDQTVSTVEARAKLMIDAIEELKRAKISHIQALYAASKKELDSAAQAAEENLTSANSFVHFAENMDRSGTPMEVLTQARDLTGRLQRYIDDDNKSKIEVSTSLMDLQFCSTVTDGAEELGRLFGSLSIRTPMPEPWPTVPTIPSESETVTPRPVAKPSRTLNPTGTARLSTALGKRGSGDGEFDWAASVFVNTEGFIIATDVRNKRLQVMDEENLYGTINLGFEPWDVACMDNGDLLVTGDGHSIHVLDNQGKEKDTINVEGFREKDKPSRGIAVDRLGRIIVTIGWQVFVLLPDGTPVHTLASSSHQLFGNQLRVTTNSDSQVIVSDWRNDIVKVFGPDGEFAYEFGLYGSGDGYFDYPTSVHTDDHNNIIVADSKNHRVSQFSKDGTFVRHLLSRDNGLWHPQGVAITPDGKLVVSDRSENSCVKIYTID